MILGGGTTDFGYFQRRKSLGIQRYPFEVNVLPKIIRGGLFDHRRKQAELLKN